MKWGFSIALLLSALLHWIVLTAPGWRGWHMSANWFADDAMPLQAQLVMPLPTAKPAKKAREVAKEAVPQSAPTPNASAAASEPVKPETAAPETLAAADTPPVEAPKVEPIAEEPTAPEIAPPLPRSGRIRFAILRGAGGFTVGQSVHEWHHDGKRYALSAVSETTGIAALFKPAKVVQTSEGGFLKGELKPDSFRFDRGGNDVVSANFDWQARQITLGDGQVFPVADGAEDFLSMFYQLMQAAQRGEGFVMAVATGKKVERYAFEWLGEEELTLKPGRFRAWHVRVRAADGGKDTTEVWLGREAAGLPIKIRNTDRKGDVFDQVAEEIRYEGQ